MPFQKDNLSNVFEKNETFWAINDACKEDYTKVSLLSLFSI